MTITRQCCHGYKRPRNAGYATPCEKFDIKPLEETATEMGAKEFVVAAKSAGLTDSKNLTSFVPLDAAYSNHNVQMQNENVS